MAKPGPRKIHRYSNEFKATAVRLSRLPGVAVQDVAAALDIHPFMLSRWRREYPEDASAANRIEIDPKTQAELRAFAQSRRSSISRKSQRGGMRSNYAFKPNPQQGGA